jgi:predicted Rossmann fold nucleotide-binding protein DprA/Smf involved in DNA uptake
MTWTPESKVNASSKSGSCLSLRAMKEQRGVVVKTNEEENRGKHELLEYEKKKLSTNPPQNIMVLYSVAEECKAVKKSAVVKSCTPLTIARDSLTKNSRYDSDKEEVLAELARSLLSFLLPKQMKYETDKRNGMEKHSMKARLKKKFEKKDKLV